MSRQWRGVHRSDDAMPLSIDQGTLLRRCCTPQDEDDSVLFVVDGSDHFIGEGLPAMLLVRGRLASSDGERGVQ